MVTFKINVYLDDDTSHEIETGSKISARDLLSKICQLKNILQPQFLLRSEDLCLLRRPESESSDASAVLYMPESYINLEGGGDYAFNIIGCLKQQQVFADKLKKYHRLISLFNSELEEMDLIGYSLMCIMYVS